MNWRRLYASLQTWFVVCLTSTFSAGCWSIFAIGLCRMAFELGDNESMLLVGLPLFIILLIVFIKFLPEPLRKAGMLSDKPERFGPWLKHGDNNCEMPKTGSCTQMAQSSYPCPCCGFLTYPSPPDSSFDICPVCFWEDDNVQANDPDFAGDANKVSLNEAKRNFAMYGACEKRFQGKTKSAIEIETPPKNKN